MAADQRNLQMFLYTDDDAAQWNVMMDNGADCAAVNPTRTAFDASKPVWDRQTRRNHVRKAVFQDPTTYRTRTCVIADPTDYAAITSATTIAVHVPGEVATVTYELKSKNAERKARAKTSRNDADHA
jgi:hypothetical protein